MAHATCARPLCVALILVFASQPTWAQARYDDHELDERLKILVGGYRTDFSDSELRVDSNLLGRGTTLGLEDQLNVKRTITVARLDGFYRFDQAHRVEWTYFAQDRVGSDARFTEEVEVGKANIPIAYLIDTKLNVRVAKVSYAWSFINTKPYEFFIGGGLNVRNISMTVHGASPGHGIDDRTFDDGDSVPLPTVSAGLRYNLTEKLNLNFRLESFFIRLSDEDRGHWDDTYLLFDYRVSKHYGFGGGINTSTTNIEFELSDELTTSLDLSHVGVMLYFTAGF